MIELQLINQTSQYQQQQQQEIIKARRPFLLPYRSEVLKMIQSMFRSIYYILFALSNASEKHDINVVLLDNFIDDYVI